MNRSRLFLTAVWLGVLPWSAQGGIIFGKQEKVYGPDRVAALIATMKSDRNDSKRSSAAEELRRVDPSANSQVIPALVETALGDQKAGVRLEALQSLSKLRPVSTQAGWALEQAVSNDPSMVNRVRARTILWQYHLSGYRAGGASSRVVSGSELPYIPGEPPLANPGTPAKPQVIMEKPQPVQQAPMSSWPRRVQGTTVGRPIPSPTAAPRMPTTAEPPLYQPPAAPVGPDLTFPR